MKDISESTLETTQSAEKELKRLGRLYSQAKRSETKERHQVAMFEQIGIVLDAVAQGMSELGIGQ